MVMKMKKLIYLLTLNILSVSFWLANFKYSNEYFQRGFYTFLALASTYLVFKIIFEEIFIKQIKESKTRYSFRKTVSIIYLVIVIAFIFRIWVETTQTLLVSYGLIAAGMAIALQDLFKNFVGGIIVFLTGIYRVGDRIEVDSKNGDVMDIGILYTTLMETREWIDGDQATGRLKIIPNGIVLSGIINNYTKDHNFIWDELSIPITYDSDWKKAINRILQIVNKETKSMTVKAEKEISQIEEKYYLSKKVIEPGIYLTLTDNWIMFSIRYITEVRDRRLLRHKLSEIILDEIQKSEKIRIASSSLDIVGMPELKLKQK